MPAFRGIEEMYVNQEPFINAVTEQLIIHLGDDDSDMDDDDYGHEDGGDSESSDNGSVRNDMDMSGIEVL